MPDKRHIAKGWKEYKMSDLASIDSKSLSNDTPEEYTFKYISLADVNQGIMNKNLPKNIFSKAPSRARRCVKKHDVLMSTVRPNLKGFARVKEDVTDVIASTGFAVMSPKIESDSEYIHQYLYSYEIDHQIYALVVGSNYPAINSTDVKKLRVLAPVLPQERERIGNILALWGTAIEKTEKLIEAKERRFSRLISRLILGGNHTRGHIRDFITEVSERNSDGEIDRVLSVTNDRGFVLPKDQFERQVASSNLSNYKIVTKGQYAYNPSRINVGSIARLDDWDKGVLSPMYVVFKINEGKVSSDFFLHWLSSHEAKERIRKSAQGSVRETVSFTDFGSIPFPLPLLEQQKYISDLLNTARQEIDILKKQADAYRKQKRGLMQKLLTGEWRVKVE